MVLAYNRAIEMDADRNLLDDFEPEISACDCHGVAIDAFEKAIAQSAIDLVEKPDERFRNLGMFQFHAANVSRKRQRFQSDAEQHGSTQTAFVFIRVYPRSSVSL